MADEAITTSIDALVKYLNEHGESDTVTIASSLKIGTRTIEGWAGVLEKANMLKISYKVGRMYLSPLVMTKENIEVVKKTVDVKKNILQTELTAQASAVSQMNVKIDELSKSTLAAQEAFKNKAGDIKVAIDTIDKFMAQADSNYKRLKDQKEFIDKQGEQFEKSIKLMQERASSIENFSLESGNAKALIADIRSKIEYSKQSVIDLQKSFDSLVSENKSRINSLASSIKDENRVLEDIALQEEKQLEQFSSSEKNYKRDALMIKQNVEREKDKMFDKVTKTKVELDRIYGSAEKEINKLNATLSGLKDQFGEMSRFSDRVKDIKTNIDQITKQKSDLGKEVNDLLVELVALDSAEKGDSETRAMKLSQIEKDSRKTSKELDDLDSKLADIKGDSEGILR